jgi:hypothetical protein
VEAFERFWSAYPKRSGSNPKAPAHAKFVRCVARGCDPESLIAAARAYAKELGPKVGTEFVAMATTWLNQQRWQDYSTVIKPGALFQDPTAGAEKVFVDVDTPQWRAWESWRRSHEGRGWPQTDRRTPTGIHRGFWFDTEWPPHQVAAE